MSRGLSESEIVAAGRDGVLELARARGLALAGDVGAGCTGCRDSDNVRHPTRSGVPRRCATCPVTREARRAAA